MEIGFTRKTLATHLSASVRYVEDLDARREGPPRIWLAGKWIYPTEGVSSWLKARTESQCNAPEAP